MSKEKQPEIITKKYYKYLYGIDRRDLVGSFFLGVFGTILINSLIGLVVFIELGSKIGLVLLIFNSIVFSGCLGFLYFIKKYDVGN